MSALAPLSKLESSVTLTRQKVRHALAEAEQKSRAQVHAFGGQVIELGKWLQLAARPVVTEVRDAELESVAVDLRGGREPVEGVDLLAFAASSPPAEVVDEAVEAPVAPVPVEAAAPEAPAAPVAEAAGADTEEVERQDAVNVTIPVGAAAGPRPKKAHKKNRKNRR